MTSITSSCCCLLVFIIIMPLIHKPLHQKHMQCYCASVLFCKFVSKQFKFLLVCLSSEIFPFLPFFSPVKDLEMLKCCQLFSSICHCVLMSAQHLSFSWLVTSVLNLSLFHFSYTVSPRTHKMDAGYLKREVGGPLRRCLAEVSEKRPYDPIEFIAHWLYKFMENKKYEEQVSLSTVVLVWLCFCFFWLRF